MSRVSTYVCNGCAAREPDDGWQPEGWTHTQDGRDLCRECSDGVNAGETFYRRVRAARS